MMLSRMEAGDLDDLRAFLDDADLTLSGLDAPTVRLWIERDEAGAIVGCTGYELSVGGTDALIRSVAVSRTRRTAGAGTRLATFAIEHAARSGARRAWLFSRRSGPFWSKLGFVPAERDVLAAALGDAHQVRLFRETGQFEREVAWTRDLR